MLQYILLLFIKSYKKCDYSCCCSITTDNTKHSDNILNEKYDNKHNKCD